MKLGLKDRVVIIGGSSRGIGLAIARGLLAEGARVALTGRDAEALGSAVEMLTAQFGDDRILAVRANLSAAGEAARVVDTTNARWDRIDCAVANAGTGTGESGWNLGADEWRRLFKLNFDTGRFLVEAVLPVMTAARAGAIVLVSSIAGLESIGAPLPYSAAKAALLSYCKNLSQEVGAYNVRVNAVAPGNVLFPGGNWEEKLEQDRDRFMRYVEEQVPLRRFGHPEEISDAVAFLLSERASFITGACLVADGGQTKRFAP